MNSQLYTATSGLIVEQRRLDMIANNLANLSTTGYRAQRSFSTVYRGFASGTGGHPGNKAVAVAGAYIVPNGGAMRATGRDLDAAIKGPGLFVVETPGGPRYTRDGSFAISDEGLLVDNEGNPFLDTKDSPISGLTGAARVGVDGKITEDDTVRGQLRVVLDPQGVLQPDRDSLLTAGGRDDLLEDANNPELLAGTLEGSGTDALRELVYLIDAQRAFESYQKLISMTMNEVNRRAVNDIAG